MVCHVSIKLISKGPLPGLPHIRKAMFQSNIGPSLTVLKFKQIQTRLSIMCQNVCTSNDYIGNLMISLNSEHGSSIQRLHGTPLGLILWDAAQFDAWRPCSHWRGIDTPTSSVCFTVCSSYISPLQAIRAFYCIGSTSPYLL